MCQVLHDKQGELYQCSAKKEGGLQAYLFRSATCNKRKSQWLLTCCFPGYWYIGFSF
jgi:hypothetical protein